MKAIEFVKKFGWCVALDVIKNIPVYDAELYSNMCYLKNAHSEGCVDHFALFSIATNQWVESSRENKSFIDESVVLGDLKQIVDAFELVEKRGGLTEAKDVEQQYWNSGVGSAMIVSMELKQAIELVEKCHG